MIKPPATRPGFTWLKKEAPDVYRDWRKFCSRFIDAYDWSYLILDENGKSLAKPRASGRTINGTKYGHKDVLNYWLGGQRQLFQTEPPKPRRLSMARIEAAMEIDPVGTIYVCSHPTSRYGILVLDVDDKEGSFGDAYEVYQYCNSLLVPEALRRQGIGLYGQPSTFGTGYHGYGFLHYPNHSPSAVRDLMDRLQEYLRDQCNVAGFQYTVEVKGQPPIVANGTYQKCGTLIKFAKLGREVSQYRKFMYQTPILDIEELSRLITSDVITTNYRGEERDRRGEKKLSRTEVRNSPHPEGRAGSTGATEGSAGISSLDANPARRMALCATTLSQRLRRPADPDEILAEYERQGLNTGTDDDHNRAKLAKVNADYVAATWKPELVNGGKRFDPASYSELIRRHVTPDVREGQRTRYRYTDDDLAICLYVVEKSTKSGDYGCPVQSFWDMAKALDRDWGDNMNTVKMRVAAMKRALLDAGLIRELEDGKYWFGNGKGRGKKYGLGPNHPDYVKTDGKQHLRDHLQGPQARVEACGWPDVR